MLERIVCLLIGYGFGLFQTGYFYGKRNGIDIRKHGSGNAGTTNALRTMGKKAGAITLLGDCMKAVLAILLVTLIFQKGHPEEIMLLEAVYRGCEKLCQTQHVAYKRTHCGYKDTSIF